MYTRWGSVRPFVLDDTDEYLPPAPPPVTSAEYTRALAEVKSIGQDSSTTRTADQTVAGKFWSATPIWTTWNQLAAQLSADHHASLSRTSSVFAALDLALADTTIVLYDAKYQHLVWRPVTAIQDGLPTAVPPISANPRWNPLTPTAADPSYPGAHSALSTAAATVLTAFYGTHQPIAVTAAADPGVTRSFPSLNGAADEAGLSRIWAGQHTRLDHQAGQQLGRQVATQVLGALPTAPNLR
jgi:membrane-associated phospholipid phosphatase